MAWLRFLVFLLGVSKEAETGFGFQNCEFAVE
jgi:hypothetical protein